jgi:2-keto-4-pentenoate hydratase/2-oxohepta-3-ene-1,7-dioic acid hydratase in catechol pathway
LRFATLVVESGEVGAILVPERGWLPLHHLDDGLSHDLLKLIERGWPPDQISTLQVNAATADHTAYIPDEQVVFAPPYRTPRKIWGIGLNYQEHAADLAEQTPSEPASFIKGAHTIIGAGEDILLPRQSQKVTSEAELGIVIGRGCYEVSEADALDYVFGFCPILDQTAEDILRQNPRYLTRAKNFPTFFSFGPEIVTCDELLGDGQRLADVRVTTVRRSAGEETQRTNVVANMTNGPARLISFHSHCMPLYPGDIISPGTPGALEIRDGDVMESRVGSLRVLRNGVRARH